MDTIKKYDFKAGLPQEIELLDLEQLFQDAKSTLTTTHRTGFFQILWFQKGNPIHTVDFTPIQVSTNTLLFLSADTVQKFDDLGDYHGKTILFTKEFFGNTTERALLLAQQTLWNGYLHIPLFSLEDHDRQIALIFEQLAIEFDQQQDIQQSSILRNLLHNLFLLAGRVHNEQHPNTSHDSEQILTINKFKELLDQKYHFQKQVAAYADELAVTPKRLNQLTQKILGKSPKTIIEERIILESKRLLSYSAYSIKEISFKLGFEENTNFIKFFKRHLHTTPNNFRVKIRK